MDIKTTSKTEEYFKKLSEEFDGNLGFTLKFLCDLHAGYYPSGHEELEHDIELLAQKIEQIEKSLENSKDEGRKMLDGRRLQ